jgi:hypothetical protein
MCERGGEGRRKWSGEEDEEWRRELKKRQNTGTERIFFMSVCVCPWAQGDVEWTELERCISSPPVQRQTRPTETGCGVKDREITECLVHSKLYQPIYT